MAKTQPIQEEAEFNEEEFYTALLGELNEKGSRDFYYLQDGSNRMRILRDPDKTNKKFFTEVTRPGWQGGEPRKKYLFRAVVIPKKGNDEETPRVQGVVVGKTVLKGIVNLIVEGYDLMDPVTGHAISITKAGSGLETQYMVAASPKPVPVPQNTEDPDQPLSELSTLLLQLDETRAEKQAATGSSETIPLNGNSNSKGAGEIPQDW